MSHTPLITSWRSNEDWLKSGRHRAKFDTSGFWACWRWSRDGGGGADGSMKWTVMSRVILNPGMQKEASASLIQHGQNDCLPLLSLLAVFIWLRIHASSLCVLIPPGQEWHPMAHVTSHNSFLSGDGSFCLWRWLITADSFVSHTVMSCHLCILLAERFCPPLSLAVHQCYTNASQVKSGWWSYQYKFFLGRADKSAKV